MTTAAPSDDSVDGAAGEKLPDTGDAALGEDLCDTTAHPRRRDRRVRRPRIHRRHDGRCRRPLRRQHRQHLPRGGRCRRPSARRSPGTAGALRAVFEHRCRRSTSRFSPSLLRGAVSRWFTCAVCDLRAQHVSWSLRRHGGVYVAFRVWLAMWQNRFRRSTPGTRWTQW